MKKITMAVIVLVTLTCKTGFAQRIEGMPSEVATGFNQEFPRATSISWEQGDRNNYLVRFKVEENNWIAFMSKTGQLQTSGKFISYKQAPMRLQTEVAKIKASYEANFGELTVTHVYEIVDDDYTRYFVNLGNNKLYLALLSQSNNEVRVIRKSVLKQPQASDAKILARENP